MAGAAQSAMQVRWGRTSMASMAPIAAAVEQNTDDMPSGGMQHAGAIRAEELLLCIMVAVGRSAPPPVQPTSTPMARLRRPTLRCDFGVVVTERSIRSNRSYLYSTTYP